MENAKILIVDDEEQILDLLEMVLNRGGYDQILRADGGAEALRLATIEHPDLILLDIMMPDVDGYEVVAHLKRRNVPTRVIMQTARIPHIRNLISLARQGVCDYLTKPYHPNEIVSAVRRALELENPFDLRSEDSNVLVERLFAQTDYLENLNGDLREQNVELQSQIEVLQRERFWKDLIERLIYLAASVGATLVLYSTGVLSQDLSILVLPLTVFLLLLLPVERIRHLYTKFLKVETKIEISGENEEAT